MQAMEEHGLFSDRLNRGKKRDCYENKLCDKRRINVAIKKIFQIKKIKPWQVENQIYRKNFLFIILRKEQEFKMKYKKDNLSKGGLCDE